MGFEHTWKVDIATGERAMEALTKFGQWAKAKWIEDSMATVHDPTPVGRTTYGKLAQRLLENSPEGQDWTGMSHCVLMRDPDEVVMVNENDDSDVKRAEDLLSLEDLPGDGQATLWWPEIAWPYGWTPDSRQRLYELLEAHDALDLWAAIIREGDRIGALTDMLMDRWSDLYVCECQAKSHPL